jgi:hypothetical protein
MKAHELAQHLAVGMNALGAISAGMPVDLEPDLLEILDRFVEACNDERVVSTHDMMFKHAAADVSLALEALRSGEPLSNQRVRELSSSSLSALGLMEPVSSWHMPDDKQTP